MQIIIFTDNYREDIIVGLGSGIGRGSHLHESEGCHNVRNQRRKLQVQSQTFDMSLYPPK